MISTFEELEKLFAELDKALDEKIHCYIIGGAVMLYHGLKAATKDIDIVVNSQREFTAAEKTLKHIGFTTKIPTLEYKKVDLNQIFVRDDYRIDLFQRTVCKGFMLSEKMRERAQKITALKNLTISLCSTTDILMFKTLTEREGDIDDCLLLAAKGVDWKAMLEEIQDQIKNAGHPVWITYIGERLDLLAEKKIVIPIMKEVDKLREEFYDYLEKKQTKKEQA